MGKIRFPNLSNVGSWEDLRRFVSIAMDDIADNLNGNVTFSGNIKNKIVEVVIGASNTEFRVNHKLGYIASNYVLVSTTTAMSLYSSTTAFDENNIYLKSSAAGTAKIMVF